MEGFEPPAPGFGELLDNLSSFSSLKTPCEYIGLRYPWVRYSQHIPACVSFIVPFFVPRFAPTRDSLVYPVYGSLKRDWCYGFLFISIGHKHIPHLNQYLDESDHGALYLYRVWEHLRNTYTLLQPSQCLQNNELSKSISKEMARSGSSSTHQYCTSLTAK